MITGETMSREELAATLRRIMVEKDLTYKEVAGATCRSIATIQRALKAENLSERTFMKIRVVMLTF